MSRVYLDNASTTKPDESVVEVMANVQRENFGNPSSIHAFGKSAKVLIEDTRDLIAETLNVSSSEVYFTSGGTEATNFAVKGIALSKSDALKRHIISSKTEHSAVLETLSYLESRFGFSVTYLNPSEGGSSDPEEVRSAIRNETILIALMRSNNETGALTDIKEMSDIAKRSGISLHCDTVQSFGKEPLDLRELGCNSAVISAHKIYGPKGIAALYIRKGTDIEKYIHGGMQERDKRGGTENTPAIAGFKRAVEVLNDRFENDRLHYLKLRSDLIGKLDAEFGDKIIYNSLKDCDKSLPNILNFSVNNDLVNVDNEMLIIMLDLKGIAVSGGSACTSGTHKPSHVLVAMGRDEKTALGAVRVSFGRDNVIQDNDRLVNALKEIIDGAS